jgi:DNA-binding response OmpR family regulator
LGKSENNYWVPREGLRTQKEIQREIERLERLVARKAAVAVVDDMHTMRILLTQALRGSGFDDVLRATDGASALRIIEKHNCDLALVDWNMPHMDGLELLDRVRASEVLKDMVFIMVTAETVDTKVIQAAEERQDAYLTKPISAEKLTRRLNLILDQRLITARALLLEAEGKVDQAAELYLEATNNNPRARWTLFRLGELFARNEQLDQAETCFNRVLELDPGASLALAYLGRVLEEKGDARSGRENYRKALNENPRFFKAYDLLAESVYTNGKPDEALQVLERAMQNQGTENALRQERIGFLYQEQDRYPEAEVSFLKALELKPRENAAKRNLELGRVRLAQGLLDDAVEPLFKAGELVNGGTDELRLDAQLLLGGTLARKGDIKAAELVFSSLTKPSNWPNEKVPFDLSAYHAKVAEVYERAGVTKLALSHQKVAEKFGHEIRPKALKGPPPVTQTRIDELSRQGLLLVEEGLFTKGLKKYHEALALDKTSPRVQFNIGMALVRMEKTEEAQRFLGDALINGILRGDKELAPKVVKVFVRMGKSEWVRGLLNNYDDELIAFNLKDELLPLLNKKGQG